METHRDLNNLLVDSISRQIAMLIEEDGIGVEIFNNRLSSENRSKLIEFSIACADSSDITSVAGTVSDHGDVMSLDDEHPIVWLLHRILISLPVTLVFSKLWGWPFIPVFALFFAVIVFF